MLSTTSLSLHVLAHVSRAAREGERVTLDGLAESLGVRRADVRSALGDLHREGFVDVLRMRPTLEGFALGAALDASRLAPLRAKRLGQRVAA